MEKRKTLYVMSGCGRGEAPEDIENILNSTAICRISSQWYYNTFEDGLSALKKLGWSLEQELKNEDALECYIQHDKSVKSLGTYTIPRKDHFIYWQLCRSGMTLESLTFNRGP